MTLATMLVVVPARDEAATITACLASIRTARAALAAAHPLVSSRVVVVADACADATAALARAAGAEVLELEACSVGRARQAGVDAGLAAALGAGEATRSASLLTASAAALGAGAGADALPDGRDVWIAMTDADSLVPPSWLVDHASAALGGADVLVGAVEPDPAGISRAVLAAWQGAHRDRAPGSSVHGANLGVRASTLAAVGGIAPLELHEDVDLVARLLAAGAVVDERAHPPVRTSSRLRGRLDGGFATYLAALAAQP